MGQKLPKNVWISSCALTCLYAHKPINGLSMGQKWSEISGLGLCGTCISETTGPFSTNSSLLEASGCLVVHWRVYIYPLTHKRVAHGSNLHPMKAWLWSLTDCGHSAGDHASLMPCESIIWSRHMATTQMHSGTNFTPLLKHGVSNSGMSDQFHKVVGSQTHLTVLILVHSAWGDSGAALPSFLWS